MTDRKNSETVKTMQLDLVSQLLSRGLYSYVTPRTPFAITRRQRIRRLLRSAHFKPVNGF